MYLQFLVKTRKWFSYNILNSRIVNFTGDGQNKANVLPNNGEKTWGACCPELVAFFGSCQYCYMTGSETLRFILKVSDPVIWQLILLLRQVVELVCAPTLSESQAAYMKVLIEEYIETRHLLFPFKKLRPKHHYL